MGAIVGPLDSFVVRQTLPTELVSALGACGVHQLHARLSRVQ